MSGHFQGPGVLYFGKRPVMVQDGHTEQPIYLVQQAAI